MTSDDLRFTLNARGEFELARAAGFDTYADFLAWKTDDPEAYERWYADLKTKAEGGDEHGA